MQKEKFMISEKCCFSGVYIILNLRNYKCYIGSSKNIKKRLKEHETALKNGQHKTKEMQKDYNDGCDFLAYPLSEVQLSKKKCGVDKNLRYYENEAIKIFDATNPQKGYNTNVICEKESEEYSNIFYKKVAFDCFVNMKEQKNGYKNTLKERNRKTKDFIEKMLKGA